MSAIGGPDIVEDGLVLTLDAANIKSFKGEPTTNLATGTLSGPIAVTLSTQQTIGPNGDTITADKVVVTSASGVVRFLMNDTINPPTQSQSYTISVWIKNISGVNATGGWEPEFSNDPVYGYRRPSTESGFIGNYNGHPNVQTIPTEWTRVTYTFSYDVQATVANRSFFYLSGNSAEVLFYQFQIEQKPYATPFVNGMRGTTVATGGGWADRSGNDNHGELVNGITYDDTNLGSLVFDGVDDYVVIDNRSTPALYPFSYSVWCKTSRNDVAQAYICVLNRSQSAVYWCLFSDNVANDLRISRRNTTSRTVTLPATIPINTWRHIHVNFNNSTSLQVFVNGNVVYSETNLPDVSNTVNANDVLLGLLRTSSPTWYLEGSISNASIYNKILNEAEVLQNYNATKGRYGL